MTQARSATCILENKRVKPAPAVTWILLFVLSIWLASYGQVAQATEISASRDPGDFIEYWASARLLVNGANPYSPEEMLSLQRAIVPDRIDPLLTWNPPWTLFFTAPFGLMSFPLAHFLWLMVNTTVLIICSPLLWKIYGGNPSNSRIAWLICFATIPTYMVLSLNQITPLVLLGIVGFLHFYSRKLFFLSGLSLTLVAIKPHLAYLYWLALLFWIIDHRQWRIFYGAIVGVATATLLPLLLVPDVFSFYLAQYSSPLAPKPLDWQTPTLSTALAYLIGSNALWVRTIPTLLGVVWLIFHWKKYRNDWDWIKQTPLLLLTSQVATPFAWTFDQILLLPALMEVAVWISHSTRSRVIIKAIVIAFTMINLGPLIVNALVPYYQWLFWMVPLYLIAYTNIKATELKLDKSLNPR
jgi:Glycosyltransferase family 87